MVVGVFVRWANVYRRTVCIGLVNADTSLAMAEISALVAAIYQRYRTSLIGDVNYSPGINSRFELFYDHRFNKVKVRLVFKTH